VVEQLVLDLARRERPIGGARVLVLGLTFKENCPDLRNTRVVDLITTLALYGMAAEVVDPWVQADEAEHEYGLTVQNAIPSGHRYGVVIAAVAHRQFAALDAAQWQQLLEPGGVIADLKGIVPRELGAMRL
jgi:UDP-N-acetyl-D-galactosamine dehydrogenase